VALPVRVVLPILATTVVSTVVAVSVNVATDGRSNVWAWIAVLVATALSAAVTLWLWRRTNHPTSVSDAGSTVDRRPDGSVSITDSNFEDSTAIQGSGTQHIHFHS
jgi:hypothetical protein